MTLLTSEFAYLQQLVFDRSAIVVSDDKMYLVESRLQPLIRELNVDDWQGVVNHTRRTRDRALETRLVEAMTTNETLWFRDIQPFKLLERKILPSLISSRRQGRRLSIWSAACSSGQELYSIAMLVADALGDLSGWDLNLLGTDVNSEVVERAKHGRYSTLEINRGLPATMLVRHFLQEGNFYRIADRFRLIAKFEQMNLAAAWPSMPKFDLICVRNVLIYFDVSTRRRVLESAARCLQPDGYLLIGSSETMMGVTERFEAFNIDGATYYQLKEDL